MSPAFPNELFNEIILHLDPFQTSCPPRELPYLSVLESEHMSTSFKAIQQCMLVSKTFHAIARPIFFSRIPLTYRPRVVEENSSSLRLHNILLHNPAIPSFVRQVQIDILPPDQEDDSLVNLETEYEKIFAHTGRYPWTGLCSILDTLASISSESADAGHGGVQHMIVNLYDPICMRKERLHFISDKVIISLIKLRLSPSLRKLTLIHADDIHPSLVFGDVYTDQLEEFDIRFGDYWLSQSKSVWKYRLSEEDLPKDPRFKRALAFWMVPKDSATENFGQLERGLFPHLKVLACSSLDFPSFIDDANKTTLCVAFPRLHTLNIPDTVRGPFPDSSGVDQRHDLTCFGNAITDIVLENPQDLRWPRNFYNLRAFEHLKELTIIVHNAPERVRRSRNWAIVYEVGSFANIIPFLEGILEYLGSSLEHLHIKAILFHQAFDRPGPPLDTLYPLVRWVERTSRFSLDGPTIHLDLQAIAEYGAHVWKTFNGGLGTRKRTLTVPRMIPSETGDEDGEVAVVMHAGSRIIQ